MALQGIEKGIELLDGVGVVTLELPHAGIRQALAEDVDEAAVDRRRVVLFRNKDGRRDPCQVIDRALRVIQERAQPRQRGPVLDPPTPVGV